MISAPGSDTKTAPGLAEADLSDLNLPPKAGDIAVVAPKPPHTNQPYDKRRLSYAGTFTNPFKATTIRTLEWMTGKITLLRLIRRFEAKDPPFGQAFFTRALAEMRIPVLTPTDQRARIPANGPLVVVANHPHGLVDGMVMAELIGAVREDYKILTRSLLTGIPEIAQFMIPVPFPHEEDSLRRSLDMRSEAMSHLAEGGVVVLFPSGSVAASKTPFGPVIEKDWNPFTAKMILKSGAPVLPICFPGQNSRLYQLANLVSATLRQGLLLHEVTRALGKPQTPIIGKLIAPEDVAQWARDPRGFMIWLRDLTLALKPKS